MFSEFNQTIQLWRTVVGTYTAGVWQNYAPVSVIVQGSVQPTRPQELQLLPEGRRVAGAYTLYTEQEVKLGDEWAKLVSIDDVPADEIVEFSQKTYEDLWQK